MVRNNSYAAEESHLFRRNNTRGGVPYTIATERLPSSNLGYRYPSRNLMLQSHDHRNQAADFDSEKASRKRIPVACGRCRQRKIKCTGPESENSPGCTACRLAGHEGCAFDRVNSNVLRYKDSIVPASEPYPYDADAGRLYQSRPINQHISYGPLAPNYQQNASNIPSTMYRTHSYAESCPKTDCCTPSYSPEYSDDGNSSFGFGVSSYQDLNECGLSMPTQYSAQPSSSRWDPVVTRPEQNIYFDTTYQHQIPIHYSQASYSVRPSNTNEAGQNFSFSNMASNLPLPSPLPGTDRNLPVPGSQQAPISVVRDNTSLHTLSRASESMTYATTPQGSATCLLPVNTHLQQQQQQQKQADMFQFRHNSSNGFPALQYATSTLPSNMTASCSPDPRQQHFGSNEPAANTQPNELYTPGSSTEWSSDHQPTANSSQHSLRSQGSQSEITYYAPVAADGLRKSSQDLGHGEHSALRVDLTGLLSNNGSRTDLSGRDVGTGVGTRGDGILSNGQQYAVPYSEAQGRELERRISTSVGMLSAGQDETRRGRGNERVGHRGSNASLRAQ